MEKIVLLEDKGVKITFVKLSLDEFDSELEDYEEYYDCAEFKIKFLLENNSNKSLDFSLNHLLVNNIVVDGSMYTEVLSGKKAFDTADFYMKSLNKYGVKGISDILEFGFIFNIIDTDTSEDYYNSELIRISLRENEIISNKNCGKELYSHNGVSLYLMGILDVLNEDEGNFGFLFSAKSNLPFPIRVQLEELNINDFMIDESIDITVLPNSCSYDFLICDKDNLLDIEVNDKSDVESIEFEVSVIRDSDYEEIFRSNPIRLNK